jgi:hypothetical protein
LIQQLYLRLLITLLLRAAAVALVYPLALVLADPHMVAVQVVCFKTINMQ